MLPVLLLHLYSLLLLLLLVLLLLLQLFEAWVEADRKEKRLQRQLEQLQQQQQQQQHQETPADALQGAAEEDELRRQLDAAVGIKETLLHASPLWRIGRFLLDIVLLFNLRRGDVYKYTFAAAAAECCFDLLLLLLLLFSLLLSFLLLARTAYGLAAALLVWRLLLLPVCFFSCCCCLTSPGCVCCRLCCCQANQLRWLLFTRWSHQGDVFKVSLPCRQEYAELALGEEADLLPDVHRDMGAYSVSLLKAAVENKFGAEETVTLSPQYMRALIFRLKDAFRVVGLCERRVRRARTKTFVTALCKAAAGDTGGAVQTPEAAAAAAAAAPSEDCWHEDSDIEGPEPEMEGGAPL
ncbi:hypothetical protein ACSSS7_008080 [Eimeria intestinalis]